MQFIVLRRLRQSEIGWFGEVRRQGRETSRQRAVNFDSVTVDRLFPNASHVDRIEMDLTRKNDSGDQSVQTQVLRRQAKNWRLTGDKIDDERFGFVAAGDLLLLLLDTSDTQPTGAFDVLPASSTTARRILSRPEAADLLRVGLLGLHPSEAGPIPALMAAYDTDLFGSLAPSPTPHRTEEPTSMQADADPMVLYPSAARMFQVVGNLGHNLPVAVADLVDNSIAARASRVEVRYPRPQEGRRWLAIIDDGGGMNRSELREAMRFGSDRSYEDRDLGKFGIGLKAASLSQARVLTVASRTAGGEIAVLRWDQDEVKRRGEWRLIEPKLTDHEHEVIYGALAESAGTVVYWDQVMPPRAVRRRSRRPAGGGVPDDAYGRALHELALHLGMVFHRFIQGKTSSGRPVELVLNGATIEAWDPFLPEHPRTKALEPFAESLLGPADRDCPVSGRAFILPHKAQFGSDADWRRAGYDGQWNQRQGLFIYRADRMIQAGGWCDIWQNDEHTKLIRVALSFDPDLDDLFEINAAKMSVTLPPLLAEQLKEHLKGARKDARKRYRDQGKAGSRPRRPARTPLQPAQPPRPSPTATATATLPRADVVASPLPSGVEGASRTTTKSNTAAVSATAASARVVGGAPPRLLIVGADGSKAWRVERTLLGGWEVRVDRNHALGGRVAAAVGTDRPAASLVAALVAAMDDVVGTDSVTKGRIEALLRAWTAGGAGSDA